MKRLLFTFALVLYCCINAFSQATSLTVDCQTPGWLSNQIVFSDQQTLENIKVTGYINGTDIKFLRELNTQRSLSGVIDLEDANIVSGGESYGTFSSTAYITADNTITDYMFANLNSLRKVILPKSTTAFNNNAHQFAGTSVDTLIINGSMESLNIGSSYYVSGYKYWKTRCIYFPEGIKTISFGSLFNTSAKLTNVELFLPLTLQTITGDSYCTDTTTKIYCNSTSPETITDNTSYTSYGTRYYFFRAGTIYVPVGTMENYQNSIFKKLNIVEDVPVEGVSIDENINLYVGDEANLNVQVLPTNAVNQKVKFESSNPEIVEVYEDGTIKGISVGTAVITVTTEDGGYMAFCTVKVNQRGGNTGNCHWTFDPSTGILRIYGSGPIGEYGGGWYEYSDLITTVVIEDGISSIGSYAFYNYPNITSVTIPSTVKTISLLAFYGCTGLTSITIPSSVTTIITNAFENCSGLTSVNLSSSLTTINSCVFSGCTSLQSVTIPSSVTSISSSAFHGCSSLTSLSIPSSVKRIDASAFYGCSSLASVTIPNSVTTIGSEAFRGCTNLASISIPSNVKTIESYTFLGCSNLTSVTIPSTVTSIKESAFYGCSSLSSVTSYITQPFSFGTNAFSKIKDNCVLYVPYGTRNAYIAAGWTEDIFKGGIVEMAAPAEIKAYAVFDNGTLTFYYDNLYGSRQGEVYTDIKRTGSSDKWGAHNTEITKVVFDPSFANARPTSTNYWFHAFKNITEFTGLNYLNTSAVTTMYAMFNAVGMSSKKITELDLTGFNTKKVTNMGSMFKNMNSLTTIKVGDGWNTGNVTTSDNMFYNCTNLVGGDGTQFNENYIDKTKAFAGNGGYLTDPNVIIIAETIPYVVYDNGTLTFYYDNQYNNRTGEVYKDIKRTGSSDKWGAHNTEITKVVFDPSFADARPTSTNYWFHACKNIAEFSGLNYLNTSSVTTMYAMFNAVGMSSKKITELDLSSFNTYKVTNMGSMFKNMNYLKTVKVGDGWNTGKVTTSDNMFYNCTSLVGGDGTTFNANYIDKTLAYAGQGGYLTDKNSIVIPQVTPYVVYSDGTLTFYYDDKYETRQGEVYTDVTRRTNSDKWGTYKGSIKNAVIESSFAQARPTSTAHWFNGCENLESIEGLEYLNTEDVTTMYGMFNIAGRTAGKLTEIDLSSFNTSNVTNMGYMFCNCTSVKRIYVSDGWTTSNVTSSEKMFHNCKNLVGGDGTTFNTNYIDKTKAYVGQGGYMSIKSDAMMYALYSNGTLTFYYDDQSQLRDGEVFDEISKKTSTNKWASYKANIKKVVFDPSFAQARPTSTAHWFNGCENLESVEGLNYLNTEDVTSMYGMFNIAGRTAGKLTEIDLTSFNTSNVTNMGYMFCNCTSVKKIYVSEGWNTDKVTSSEKMFHNCKSIVGGDGTTFNANYVDKTLAHGEQGGYLTDPNAIVVAIALPYAVYNDGTLTFYYDNQYDSRTGDVYTNIVRKRSYDGWGAHKDLIVKVVFNSSFANARPTSTAQWFNGCNALASISGMKYLNTSEVTSMYAMFNGCSVLKAADLSNFNTAKVEDMSYMLNSCPKLTYLNLKSFDTSKVTNMNYMFNSCAALQTIEVGTKWNTDNVTTSTRMFTACKKLMGSDATRYSDNVTDKEAAHTDEGGYLTGSRRAYAVYEDGTLTFYYDDQSTKRTGDIYTYLIRAKWADLWGAHREETTKVVFDQSFADTHPGSFFHWFNSFKILTTIEGIEYLNTSDVTTMYAMFNGCKAITSLDLSNFDTGMVAYMGYMFNSCSKLKTIYVSDLWNTSNVRSSDMMFSGCKAIVGGDGTKYDSNYIDKTKAYAGSGGYLTYLSNNIKVFNTTVIDDIMATTTGDIYTLQGVHVGKNIELNTLPKGIYIVNGKKVMVK